MNGAASSIPILRFRAGKLPCAVAARDVQGLRDTSAERRPLWQLLGLPPAIPEADGGGWILRLAAGDAAAEVEVQGPIELAEVTASDVLRRPLTLVLTDDDLIFGFARCAQELVVLLDIPTLVKLAS